MKRIITAGLAACLTFTLAVPAFAKDFSDTADHWAKDAISQISDLGVFNGTGDDTFSPNSPMTRGMFVTVLGRLADKLGLDSAAKSECAFTDVAADAYYAPFIAWANENGIVNGTGGTGFSPDVNITREQMCAILVRFLNWGGADLSQYSAQQVEFVDGDSISEYAREAVGIASALGLIQGSSTDGGMEFRPQANATRAEAATILVRQHDKAGDILPDVNTDPEPTPPPTEPTTPPAGGGTGGGGVTPVDPTPTPTPEQPPEPTEEEKAEEAEISGYLKTILTNYKNSEYIKGRDQAVKDCVAVLMDSIQDALNKRDNGQFLSREYIKTQYAAQIDDFKAKYDALTEDQLNQINNVIVRLGESEELYAIMDYFGVSY